MKKGQKIRVLADNRIGTIIDSHVIDHGGKRYVAHQVRFMKDKGAAPWFPADKLGSVTDKCTVTVTDEQGQSITMKVSRNNETKDIDVQCEVGHVLRESVAVLFFAYLMSGIRKHVSNVQTIFS